MTGEIEYNDLYYTSHQTIDFNLTQDANGTHSHGVGTISEVDEPRFYPVTAHVVLTVFIIVVAIVIMNLLFGMAVSDVQVSRVVDLLRSRRTEDHKQLSIIFRLACKLVSIL